MRAMLLAVILLSATSVLAAPPDPATFAAMPLADRRVAYAALSRDDQAALFASLSQQQLVAMAKVSLAALGSYEGELTKQERIDGKIIPSQTMKVQLREAPYAVRLEVTQGPPKGRKVLYNAALRPKDLRAKEGGMLGIAGGLWIDINGSLARRDSGHAVTDTGFGNMLRIIEGNLQLAEPAGGMTRKDEGFEASGWYCMKVSPPKAVQAQAYGVRSRLCFDPVLGLPVSIQVDDAHGFLESFTWRNVVHRDYTDADFTPAGFGL